LGAYTTFHGRDVDSTAVLLAYTRTADANLDEVVDNDDVTVLGASYAPGSAKPSWALGDFEYNGFVDHDDVTLLGVFYAPQAQPAPTVDYTDELRVASEESSPGHVSADASPPQSWRASVDEVLSAEGAASYQLPAPGAPPFDTQPANQDSIWSQVANLAEDRPMEAGLPRRRTSGRALPIWT
jgi:hypothetical protein